MGVTVRIAAPVDRVWQLVAAYERMPEWAPVREVVRRRPGEGSPSGVGSVRTVRGLGLVVDERVAAFKASERIETVVVGGAPIRDHRGEVSLQPVADGTKVGWTMRFRPLVPGTGWLLGWVLRRALGTALEGLRIYAETGEAPRRRGKIRRPRRGAPLRRE